MAIRNSRIRFEASCNHEDAGVTLCCRMGSYRGDYIVSTVIGTPDDPAKGADARR